MKLRFKKLDENAVLPSYAKEGDAGLDITAISDPSPTISSNGEDLWHYIEYKTGLSVEIPEGYVGLLFPRSSVSKSALILANSVGVVDSGYRGEICFRFKLDGHVSKEAQEFKVKIASYKAGDRIGQLVVLPYPKIEAEWAETLSSSQRGETGFGSSGK